MEKYDNVILIRFLLLFLCLYVSELGKKMKMKMSKWFKFRKRCLFYELVKLGIDLMVFYFFNYGNRFRKMHF